ncbi:Hypothetical protein FKW44_006285 [Caligus rogercresseyi]|uniref:Uncharacterized protein n=1 Tax=Caligus rogercresseyi TaxID=217165 RepID=A0A7T8QST0_CALRO|nr:Hypothetical protein FKW44_006285 [Caligus rogercresseyi]
MEVQRERLQRLKKDCRNDCYLATIACMVPPINATKHPQVAILLGVVARDGKSMPPFWPQGDDQ